MKKFLYLIINLTCLLTFASHVHASVKMSPLEVYRLEYVGQVIAVTQDFSQNRKVVNVIFKSKDTLGSMLHRVEYDDEDLMLGAALTSCIGKSVIITANRDLSVNSFRCES